MKARPSSAVVLWAVLGAGTSSLHAAPRPFSVGPPPSWVEHVAVDTKQETPANQVSSGVYYLLADHQVRVAASVEAYHHIARRIVNDAGVGNGSELNLHFDPAFQGMRIHFLRILRGPQLLERLVPAKIQVIQREPELESRIYDGSLSAIAFIEDVRVGDVIEYAYTVTGTNPVFAGRYSDSFGVDWSVPLHRMRFRLLWPAGRALFIRNHRTSMAPATREGPSGRELVWDEADPDPVADAPSLPRGYDPWGWVQLGEHETWADVARWGTALFVVPEQAPAAAEDLLAAWRKASADPAMRVLAALRFVQDEVRYLGMEMGVNSHRPAPPDVVLQRRFGDCKDKALLFCTLARALGARAQPALVRSPSGKGLDEWNPSPLAFNHVVARVEVEGRTY
jgi:transglutaminase-like putative cysteine protease